jgi:hypothetical protein
MSLGTVSTEVHTGVQAGRPFSGSVAEVARALEVNSNEDRRGPDHDRTGRMIAAYRMAEQGWTAEEAKKEMEAYGFRSAIA